MTMIDTPSTVESQLRTEASVAEKIETAARAAALWDIVHRPATRSTFDARVNAVRLALRQMETELSRHPLAQPGKDAQQPHCAVLRELRANPRLLRSAVIAVSGNRRVLARLPRVVISKGPPGSSGWQDEPRAAAVAATYLRAMDGEFSTETFRALIQALQAREPLTVEELWNLVAFIRFVLLESILRDAERLLRSSEVVPAPLLEVHFKSLRSVTNADLAYLIEPLIVFDDVLRQDPAESYGSMDFESRELYRKRVAFIASHCDSSETEVAQAALDLARKAMETPARDPRLYRRRIHVGYYLLDQGFTQLADRISLHPPFVFRARSYIRAHSGIFYITGIQLFSILFMSAALFPVLPDFSAVLAFIAALLFLFPPAMQVAVDLVNAAVTSFFDPDPLPKLDFSHGIPAEFTTLVTVPSLLLDEQQVRELVASLEIRYLGNRDTHLHFALLTDLADSASKPRENDSHPLVELASGLIDELNAKYSSAKRGSFMLLHRHRIFNSRQGVWMGWERKRGKLLDLNKLLAGEFDAFPIKAGKLDVLGQVRYVLTLDSDTQLPYGAAAKLIGAIAHPLNQAIIDPGLRMVTAGYGIMQPRVGIAIQSASRTRLASIYSGQSGMDIYSRAISDAYQDLFGEGSFTGKGIYEAAILHAVLDRRFPRNSLLSHDLIEGAYSRAGLASDIELIDDYPSHFSAYSRRKHRWMRGDWQIAQWMFSRVPDESGRYGDNPLSDVSRWKIFDNLRRSLVDPFLFVLLVAGWLGLPGGPLYWTAVSIALLVIPGLIQLVFGLGRAFARRGESGAGEVFLWFGRTELVALLQLVLLPHQALLAIDAIVRSLVRRFITGERLLEWETAAQSEVNDSNRTHIDRYLTRMPLVVVGLAGAVWFFAPNKHAIYVAAPVLLLWALATFVALWLNQPANEQRCLAPSDEQFLLAHALRIWRYFLDFSKERHNFLIPDNVEEDGLQEAARVSPTNIGLLLNARQAACELGFLTVDEFADLTARTLGTVSSLVKFRGHLYNWYDTETLDPLNAGPFISSVDSGNFVASLYALSSGARELVQKPLLTLQLFTALRAHLLLKPPLGHARPRIKRANFPTRSAALSEWICWLWCASESLSRSCDSSDCPPNGTDPLTPMEHRVLVILSLIRNYLPWMLPEYAPLRTLPQLALDEMPESPNIHEALVFAESLSSRLSRPSIIPAEDQAHLRLSQRLRGALAAALHNLHNLGSNLTHIAQGAERMAEETAFDFLVDPGRQILSIGYDLEKQQLHEACYDMIASEARIATFVAIARGDLPQRSWFKLSREYVQAFGHTLLLSWTGTMFEYLMPALWMRSYPGTLIGNSQAACVHVQQSFARALDLPWGISESGSSRKDDAGHYQYQAFGVPSIALWYEATAGPVVSPYSSFIALEVDAPGALSNLRRMASGGCVGPYGFYEAVDYISSLRNPVLVREWMAHHQGMSLLAILNLLRNNVMQRWFHAIPLIQAAEQLLHEMPPGKSAIKTRLSEFAPLQS